MIAPHAVFRKWSPSEREREIAVFHRGGFGVQGLDVAHGVIGVRRGLRRAVHRGGNPSSLLVRLGEESVVLWL